MMENESLRGSKNTTVVFLSLLLVAAVIWGIVASVMASKNRERCDQLTQEKEQIRQEAEQTRMEAERRMMDADKLRKTCLEWTRQRQLQLQAEMRKKAEAAAAAAKTQAAKTQPTAKTTGKSTAKVQTSKKTLTRH